MTFSIVAWDPDAQPSPEWGVAVASKFLAVGAVVPWAAAGAGAIATQAFANLAYGPDGLDGLRSGRSAQEMMAALTQADSESSHRQLGIVDAQGGAATFTGSECFEWAGGVSGDGYCCQGNILKGSEVVSEMVGAFTTTQGDLGTRLLAALRAGDDAGGDRRGRQSAALLVVREGGAYGGSTDKALDLRVDDHPLPVIELIRLLELHKLYFPRPSDLDFIDVDEELAGRLRGLLSDLGYDVGSSTGAYDKRLRDALYAYAGTENLEERWSDEPKIERAVLDHLESTAKTASEK